LAWGVSFLTDVRSLAAHLLDGAFHEGSPAQFLDRGMQKRGVDIDRKVMNAAADG
jgi:hypothetical protein